MGLGPGIGSSKQPEATGITGDRYRETRLAEKLFHHLTFDSLHGVKSPAHLNNVTKINENNSGSNSSIQKYVFYLVVVLVFKDINRVITTVRIKEC